MFLRAVFGPRAADITRPGVSVSARALPPNNYKKMLCGYYVSGGGGGEACPNQDNCTYAHGPEELEKYKKDCQG